MHRNPPNRREFALYVCLDLALGRVIAGAVWLALN
ncbi:hypothetical protein PMI07_006666 [Rhizobium sp. CF080]|nr:hypothetical protein PMI07_006666 [Rhizobium sp. CF080]